MGKQPMNERRRSEAESRPVESRYTSNPQQPPHAGSFGWDVSTGEIFWSDESSGIFGCENQIGPTIRLVLERVHPDDVSYVTASIDSATQNHRALNLEYRLILPDSSVRCVHVVAHPVNIVPNKTHFMGAVMDITRRKTEEEQQQELHAAINNAPIAVWTSSADGVCEYANEGWLSYLNLTMEEALGLGWMASVHPDDLPSHRAVWRISAKEGVPFQMEARWRRFDGEYRWFLNHAVARRDENGAIVKWYGACVEINDRVRAEEEVRRNEQRYRYLFYNMPVALLQVDTRELMTLFGSLRSEGVADLAAYIDDHPDFPSSAMACSKVEEVNELAIRMFGVSDSDEMTRSFAFFWQRSPGVYRRMLESRFRDEEMFQEEAKVVALDGHVIDVLVTAARPGVIGGAATSIVGFTDISENVRTREMLQQLQAEFARAARVSMLGELTASIAHEVNQPLAAIQTNVQTTLRWLERTEPNVPKARELVQRVLYDASRASEIIARTRAMVAGRPPEQVSLALNDIIAESLQFLQHEFNANDVVILVDLAPLLPIVRGDRTQLQQVVVNLGLNAVQAFVKSDVTRRSISIRTTRSDSESVCCTVEDSGPGIEPRILPVLFDSFFTTKDTGTGMGLRISRSIIDAHGGQLLADNNSRLGGARFTFILPTSVD